MYVSDKLKIIEGLLNLLFALSLYLSVQDRSPTGP
jgi:hypothetical protein